MSVVAARGGEGWSRRLVRGIRQRRTIASLLAVAVAISMVVVGISIASSARSSAPSGQAELTLASGPSFKVTPNSAAEGVSVAITGTGFAASSTAYFALEDPALPSFDLTGQPYPYNKPLETIVSATGTISANYRVVDINPGVYSIHLTDGSVSLHRAFTVTSSASGVTFRTNVTSVAPGQSLKLIGAGFYPMDGENFYISWHNAHHLKLLKPFADSTAGTIHHVWHVPTTFPAGTYLLIVVGDTYGTGVAEITIT